MLVRLFSGAWPLACFWGFGISHLQGTDYMVSCLLEGNGVFCTLALNFFFILAGFLKTFFFSVGVNDGLRSHGRSLTY